MAQQRAFIAPYELGLIDGLGEVFTLPGVAEASGVSNPSSVLYGSMIQAGLDTLEVVGPDGKTDGLPDFIAERLNRSEGLEWGLLHVLVGEAFKLHLPSYGSSGVGENEFLQVHSLVSNLLYALESGQNIILLSDLETIRESAARLPAELAVPLCHLLGAVTTVEPELVIPRSDVRVEDLDRFRGVLTSPVFQQYQSMHGALTSDATPPEDGVAGVVAAAKALCDKNAELLARKRTLVSLLPFVSPAVLSAFGTLPGIISVVAQRVLGPWLQSGDKLAIYQLHTTKRALIERLPKTPPDSTD